MRDGIELVADIFRPDADGSFPALVAASPYARQLQDVGIPAGFIEAGATDFWVPRGYVHVIVNLRGTGGSGGTFGFFDSQERRDMYDLIEWVAEQGWCDGNVGMLGISYFAMTQLEAAVERPPHLKAIFPFAATTDLYDAASHHGLASTAFVSSFLSMLGLTTSKSDKFYRSAPFAGLRRIMNQPRLHKKFATMNGESAKGMLNLLMKLPHPPRPWDELWLDAVVKHPLRDDFWDDRDLTPLLENIDIPVYLGCDWENAPLHLPSTFSALPNLAKSPCVRVAVLGKFGLTWPWESMHIEALAWYDHWLKGQDTGILDGPAFRYFLPQADEWKSVESWPPPEGSHREYALRADGALATAEGEPGQREYLTLGTGLNRPKPSEIDPPAILTWTSAPLDEDLDVAGDIELRLVASATALDTAWIAVVSDIAEDGSLVEHLSGGFLRASMREVDEDASRPGYPVLPCRTAVGRADRPRRRLPNPVGPQRPPVPARTPHPVDAVQRRLESRRCRRSWTSVTPTSAPAALTRSGRRRGCCCRCWAASRRPCRCRPGRRRRGWPRHRRWRETRSRWRHRGAPSCRAVKPIAGSGRSWGFPGR